MKRAKLRDPASLVLMPSTHRKLSIYIAILFALASIISVDARAASEEVVLMANYHATFRAGAQFRQMKAQAKLADRSQFPIEFDDFRIFVSLTSLSPNEYSADLTIEELTNAGWRSINPDTTTFRSSYSVPTEFKWELESYSFELAIAVSIVDE